MTRNETKRINVGGVAVGGGAPVSVQSMTNTKTDDIEATLAQISRLREAGCEIVRLAVPDMESARAIGKIKERAGLPIVADIHFDARLAVEAVSAGADKIRINPGNIGSDEKVRMVVNACRAAGVPIRVGVNSGSLARHILEKYGSPTPEAMAESACEHAAMLERFDFTDICISLKSSNVETTARAYRLAAERLQYPLHLGLTEAGTAYTGLVRSAVGMGSLLLDGIGDTIRVSLTDDPVEEIRAGIEILRACGLRTDGPRLISCPTCGRCRVDLIGLARQAEERLGSIHKNITVAVMGCAVNGPGEAREADYGIAGADGSGVLFKKGQVVGKAPEDGLIDALIELIESENT